MFFSSKGRDTGEKLINIFMEIPKQTWQPQNLDVHGRNMKIKLQESGL